MDLFVEIDMIEAWFEMSRKTFVVTTEFHSRVKFTIECATLEYLMCTVVVTHHHSLEYINLSYTFRRLQY